MATRTRNAHIGASSPLLAACAAWLCQCSLLSLQGLDNGTGPDGPTTEMDATAELDSMGVRPLDATVAEDSANAFDGIGPADIGSSRADSSDDGIGLSDRPAEMLEAGADAFPESGRDANAADTGGPGAVDAARSCDPAKSFGAPVLVAGVQSMAKEGSFRLLQDELTGFLWSDRPGGPGTANLYVTTRPDTNSPFGGPVLLKNVNAVGQIQIDPTVTRDGLTIAFRSVRAGGPGGWDVLWASRATIAGDFSIARLMGNVNSSASDVQPFLVPDGSEIYFSSNRTGDYDLYRATGSAGSYGAPSVISELNLKNVSDQQPIVSGDDLTILFSSDRPGGVGASDIWMATRPTAHSTFGAPTNLTRVNTIGLDYPDWLSPDGCRLYISSDVSGSTHIYLATRTM